MKVYTNVRAGSFQIFIGPACGPINPSLQAGTPAVVDQPSKPV